MTTDIQAAPDVDKGIKIVNLKDLPSEERAAILKATGTLKQIRENHQQATHKTTVTLETTGGTEIPMPDAPVKAVSKPTKAKKPPKGAMTSLEVATAKERVFVVNGIKFFAAVGSKGHRMLTACDPSKTRLESAARVLFLKGYVTGVKRTKADKKLWVLDAKEKNPSGPWPDEEPKPATVVGPVDAAANA